MRRRIKPVVHRKRIYIIYKPKRGEKLSEIARRFSLQEPEKIYRYKRNWRFRTLNRDPENIRRPVRIFIPVEREWSLPPHLLRTQDLARGNKIEYLIDGVEVFPEFIKAIRGAKETINLETYIFENDKTGREIAKELMKKAKEGVRVNILLDDWGSRNIYPLDNKMRKGGIRLVHAVPFKDSFKYYIHRFLQIEPIDRRTRFEARGLDNRDHRKLMVIDGKTAFLGGLNIADEYSGAKGEMWHDVHLKVQGPIVNALQSHFFERWMTERGKVSDLDLKNYFPVIKEHKKGISAEVVATVPGVKKNIFKAYLKAIKKARKYIKIENAYLAHPRIIRALKRAARRGVLVTVIVPLKHQDVPLINDAMEHVYHRLGKRGIRILEYPHRMCHTKATVIDGQWATIGSANLDNRSMKRDSELNLIVWDKKFIKDLERDLFDADIEICRPIKKPSRPGWTAFKSWLFTGFYRYL